ncbi:MAG: UDP-N-acetylglucosamine 1-carboxyvinyltransferase [Verrucomicrobium sp.]|nr:UDP-N-acetylglucosamine 1-carboxyvinyltransferase [Verrucomicrobium sp.]
MDKLIVKGGKPLRGKIAISGSKNSALPILAATLLTPEPCVLHRVPDLSDVRYMLEILEHLGAEVSFKDGTVRVCAAKIHSEAPYELVRKMRASICVLGPLLARCGRATVSLPGGCVIGDRPIDIHLRGLEALGAHVESEDGNIVVTSGAGLKGAEIPLGGKFGSTVLGTDNVMMAATAASGTTRIENAAAEPEVQDLANFLAKMGAKIRGQGTKHIEIDGGTPLHGAEHTVIPDRIEAGTFVIAGLITNGDLTLEGVDCSHMENILEPLRKSGALLEPAGDSLRVRVGTPLKPLDLVTEVYPGFPTDMQAQFCALLAMTPGISAVTEKIFPNRYMHLSELKRMGANIDLEGSTAILRGVAELDGAPVMASDLRASAALVLAGLAAQGTTEVNRVYHIDRGYERIDEKLRQVGADIERQA